MAQYEPENFIETYSGVRFNFSEPNPDDIRIVDIAHALSNLCRYNGHCCYFYSVAEHSILMTSAFAAKYPDNVTVARAMLLHDAAEAYLCDIPRPIKYTLPDYRAAEAKLDAVIARKFELPMPHPAIVKEFDSRIIVDERRQVMSKSGHKWGIDSFEPLDVTIRFLPPLIAEQKFLQWYKALSL